MQQDNRLERLKDFTASYPDKVIFKHFDKDGKYSGSEESIIQYDTETGHVIPAMDLELIPSENSINSLILRTEMIPDSIIKEEVAEKKHSIMVFVRNGKEILTVKSQKDICKSCVNSLSCMMSEYKPGVFRTPGREKEGNIVKRIKINYMKAASGVKCRNYIMKKSLMTESEKIETNYDPSDKDFFARFVSYYSNVSINEIYSFNSSLMNEHNSRFCGKLLKIPKRKQGIRVVVAPSAKMKKVLSVVHKKLVEPIELNMPDEYRDTVTAFRAEGGIGFNAGKHTGKDWLISIDLKNFFHAIDFKTVKRFFNNHYGDLASHYIANFCTYQFDKQFVHDNNGNIFAGHSKCMPQGWPTSPTISNLIGYELLDKALITIVKDVIEDNNGYNFSYTRYADDVTVSFNGNHDLADNVTELIINHINKKTKFKVNNKKIKQMHKTTRQYCCGVVVNEKVNISRSRYRKDRAMVDHYCKGRLPYSYFNKVMGNVSYGLSIAPAKYIKLKQKLEEGKKIRTEYYHEKV